MASRNRLLALAGCLEIKKKNERIVKALIDKTKEDQISWEQVLGPPQRTYRTEYNGMPIELRDCGYTLEIDSYTISTQDIDAGSLEQLDSEIQLALRSHSGSSHSSRTLSLEKQADKILDHLQA